VPLLEAVAPAAALPEADSAEPVKEIRS